MKRLPTDLQILNTIYDKYYDEFEKYSDQEPNRSSKIYVPIDIEQIAENLKVDKDIVFGRLYYHLNKKHGYRQNDNSSVHLFTIRAGDDKNCVNFPLVASVLADLRIRNRNFVIVTFIAVGSLIVSVISIVISILKS